MSEPRYWQAEFGMVLQYRGRDKEIVMLIGPANQSHHLDAVNYITLGDDDWAPDVYPGLFDVDDWECIAEPDEGVRGR